MVSDLRIIDRCYNVESVYLQNGRCFELNLLLVLLLMSLNNYHCVQNNKMTQSEKDLNLFIVDRRHQNYTRPSMNKSGAVNL